MKKVTSIKFEISFIEIILAGIGFGFLGIFAKIAFAYGMSIGELLTFRFTLAAIILWVTLFFYKRKIFFLPLKQIIISCFLGVAGYAIFSTMYFKSIEGVSVAIAAMLLFTFPVFVNLGAHFFLKEKLHSKQWQSLGMTMMGLMLLLWGDMNVGKFTAIFWGLGAAIIYSAYVLISGVVQKNVNPLSSSVYVISSAAITLFVYHSPNVEKILNFELKEFLLIFGIAIISTIMPLTLFLSGMQKITSSKAAIIVTIEPVTAALAGWLILNEQLSYNQIIGALIIIYGLLLNQKK